MGPLLQAGLRKADGTQTPNRSAVSAATGLSASAGRGFWIDRLTRVGNGGERFPITLPGAGDKDFGAMEQRVAGLEAGERPLDAAARERLALGRVLTTWQPRPDGLVEEYTLGVVDVPLERFLAVMPARDWGRNLADWKGGAVRPAGPDRQIERMVLESFGKDLDMTKVETVREERDAQGRLIAARIRWEVLESDNGSVITDVGTVRFERFGDKTLVTWHSAHKLNVPPLSWGIVPRALADPIVGFMLTRFFRRCTERYRKIAAQAG
jgi:hypothetical protein